MSASPARFTAHGTFVSIPMETAARAMGVGAYTSPTLAWTALRGVRRRNAEKAAARTGVTRSPFVGGLPMAMILVAAGSRPETGARGYFPGADIRTRGGDSWLCYQRNRGQAIGEANIRRSDARRARLLSLPPIMGGSPYADRGTGWHAEGCLCRACNA